MTLLNFIDNYRECISDAVAYFHLHMGTNADSIFLNKDEYTQLSGGVLNIVGSILCVHLTDSVGVGYFTLRNDYSKQALEFTLWRRGLSPWAQSITTSSHVSMSDAIDKHYEKLANLDGICYHEFKHYTGFQEAYDYCTKCDEKRQA